MSPEPIQAPRGMVSVSAIKRSNRNADGRNEGIDGPTYWSRFESLAPGVVVFLSFFADAQPRVPQFSPSADLFSLFDDATPAGFADAQPHVPDLSPAGDIDSSAPAVAEPYSSDSFAASDDATPAT